MKERQIKKIFFSSSPGKWGWAGVPLPPGRWAEWPAPIRGIPREAPLVQQAIDEVNYGWRGPEPVIHRGDLPELRAEPVQVIGERG